MRTEQHFMTSETGLVEAGRDLSHLRRRPERVTTSVGELRRLPPHPDALPAARRQLERMAERLAQRAPSRYERWVKPVIDRVVAAVLVLLFTPVLLVVAIAVLIAIGRPVLFGQTRIGRDGRAFSMFKFRTMLPDRRDRQGSYDGPERRRTHKSPDDPRHTPLGRLMRKLSLDELPQLFNVLRGEMSLVGPRPELVDLTATFEPWQRMRHVVKPGVTGLWQVTERGRGRRLHECVDVDLTYIDGLSFRRDLLIFLRTPIALLRTRGVF